MDRGHLGGIDHDPDIEGRHERDPHGPVGQPEDQQRPRPDHTSGRQSTPSASPDSCREPSSTSLSDQTAISTSSTRTTVTTPACTSTTAWAPYSTQEKSTAPTLYSTENAQPILYSTENTSPILYSAESKADLHAHDHHWENPLHRPPHAVLAKESDGEVVTIPDGGWRAWLVVLGAGHVTFATFGFVNAWGVFQEYYAGTMFLDKTTSQIGWVGSLQYMLIYLPAVLMGRLVDRGIHYIPYWVGWVLYALSCFLTAQVKEYWQALLSHGLLFGLSAGLVFCPAIAVPSQWFLERRAFALGIVAACSSLGGTVFPILALNCLERLGFAWTMRICGFVIIYCGIVASLTLRNYLPPKKTAGGVLNLKAFKDPAYAFLVFGSFLIMGGLYTPLSYLDVMARRNGLGDFSTYLIAIANASSLFGRLGPAAVADRIGPLNILIPGLVGSAITTFIWPFATSKAALVAIAVTNGVFQGCYVSLIAPACASLGAVDDIGRRFGMVNTVMAFGALLGAPVSGAILQKGTFHEVSYYAAALVLGGCACMAASRYFALGQLWGRI